MDDRRRLFWMLQTGGWAVFWSAMFLAGVSHWTLPFTLVHKSSLTLFGFLLTTLLRVPYSALRRREASLPLVMTIAVPLSCGLAAIWMAAHNLVIGSYVDVDAARAAFPNFTNTICYAFVMIAWSLFYFAVHSYLDRKQDRERLLTAERLAHEARLHALRLQLNPHFLFNTMNAISTLVADRRNDEANEMLSRLSEFLRQTLDRGDTREIALADEVAFARQYLEIEKVRFGERLRVEVDVDPALATALVPPMILQPLVENAVRHAVLPSERGARVTIRARREGDAVMLSVRDDGDDAPHAAAKDTGIGLSNTRQRLTELYGSRSEVKLERGDAGVTVSLRIPVFS
jgi:two-component sensor histidine kinase